MLQDSTNGILVEGGFYNYQGRHILRYDVQSRHINSKQYKCYVEYIPYKNEIGGIKDYSCNCANGKRTVGICGHFASIIFFLSYARFESKNFSEPLNMLKKQRIF